LTASTSLRVEHIWGTAIGVDIRDTVDLGLVDEIFSWFRRVDDLFSTWRPETEISRIGRGELTLGDASPEVSEVLGLCEKIRVQSDGAFDVTVGADPRITPRAGLGPVDPSGLVKGWALDRAAGTLERNGIVNFTLNAGGDVITHGRPHPADEWRIGIQHPWASDKVAAVVGGNNLAVATSGQYERGEHILDPRTGQPPKGLIAVTVITEDLAHADGYATAAVALGHDGMRWLATLERLEAMGITNSHEVVLTAGFQRHRRQ